MCIFEVRFDAFVKPDPELFDVRGSEERFVNRKGDRHEIVRNVEERYFLLEFTTKGMPVEVFALGFVVEDDAASGKAEVGMCFDDLGYFLKVLLRYVVISINERHPIGSYMPKTKVSSA